MSKSLSTSSSDTPPAQTSTTGTPTTSKPSTEFPASDSSVNDTSVNDTSGATRVPITDVDERTPDYERTGEVRLVTGSIPVVQAATPHATGQHPVIKVVSHKATRFRGAPILLLLVGVAVGFLVVSQLSGSNKFREQLGTESEGDLARILASLSAESSALQQELGSLKVERATVANSAQEQGSAAAATNDQLRALQVLAGTVPVAGPGLQMTIEDPANQVKFESLVDAVQELRDAGAEALAINGRRIGVNSYFGAGKATAGAGRITLDGVPLPVPYSLDAIGPASTLEGGLKIPGGSLDSLRALTQVKVDVTQSNNLILPALEQAPTFRVARPVGSDS